MLDSTYMAYRDFPVASDLDYALCAEKNRLHEYSYDFTASEHNGRSRGCIDNFNVICAGRTDITERRFEADAA
jgi:hypothetical protein